MPLVHVILDLLLHTSEFWTLEDVRYPRDPQLLTSQALSANLPDTALFSWAGSILQPPTDFKVMHMPHRSWPILLLAPSILHPIPSSSTMKLPHFILAYFLVNSSHPSWQRLPLTELTFESAASTDLAGRLVLAPLVGSHPSSTHIPFHQYKYK